jgi:TRAP-type C4-dicarboxylate transport system substrate-binding protein
MDLINRRQLVAGSASALAFGATQLAHAQSAPKLRFSSAFTETDLRAEAYKAFAAAMKDDFDFEPYWGNTLFKQGTELVALQHFQTDSGLVAVDLRLPLPRLRSSQEDLPKRRGPGVH